MKTAPFKTNLIKSFKNALHYKKLSKDRQRSMMSSASYSKKMTKERSFTNYLKINRTSSINSEFLMITCYTQSNQFRLSPLTKML